MPRIKLTVLWAALLGVASLAPVFPRDLSVQLPPDDTAVLIIRPVQCLDNAWEREWVSEHKATSKIAPVYPIQEENRIIKEYFARKSVTVWDVRKVPYRGGALCQRCDCERGDSLYIRVNATDMARLKEMGYDKVLPEFLNKRKKK